MPLGLQGRETSSRSAPILTLTPSHIFLQIKDLIRKYIQRQETINLVVVPCNVDIATTEALSMAQEVDPEGDRTIGEKREEPENAKWSDMGHVSLESRRAFMGAHTRRRVCPGRRELLRCPVWCPLRLDDTGRMDPCWSQVGSWRLSTCL